jgi:hypothetical protein
VARRAVLAAAAVVVVAEAPGGVVVRAAVAAAKGAVVVTAEAEAVAAPVAAAVPEAVAAPVEAAAAVEAPEAARHLLPNHQDRELPFRKITLRRNLDTFRFVGICCIFLLKILFRTLSPIFATFCPH